MKTRRKKHCNNRKTYNYKGGVHRCKYYGTESNLTSRCSLVIKVFHRGQCKCFLFCGCSYSIWVNDKMSEIMEIAHCDFKIS